MQATTSPNTRKKVTSFPADEGMRPSGSSMVCGNQIKTLPSLTPASQVATPSTSHLSANVSHPVPASLTGKTDRGVFLANMPSRQQGSELVGYTPRLQDLIEDAMPLFWHVLERNLIESERPVHLFYVNSADSLQENGRRMIDLFTRLSGTDRICLPISSCHSMLVNTFRFALPYLREMDLDEVALVYIGENANRKTMETVSKECGMAFYFHAFY